MEGHRACKCSVWLHMSDHVEGHRWALNKRRGNRPMQRNAESICKT